MPNNFNTLVLEYYANSQFKTLQNELGVFEYIVVGDLFKQYIEILLNFKFKYLRVHKYTPDCYTLNHTDNDFNGCSTLIINIKSNKNDNRLIIDGKIIPEKENTGILIDENTHYEVLKGKYEIHMLVCCIE